MSDRDSPEARDRAEGALDDISLPVVIPEMIALSIHVPKILAMRNEKTDPSFSRVFSRGIAVVSLIAITRFGRVPGLPGPRLELGRAPSYLFQRDSLAHGFGLASY